MDLAVVTGRGAPELTGLAGAPPIVAPARVALVGHRPASLGADVAEELALVPEGVRQVLAPEVRRRGGDAVAARAARPERRAAPPGCTSTSTCSTSGCSPP